MDGHKVVIVTKDDETSAQQDVVAFDSVLSDNIQAVLGGPYNTGEEAMAPLAAKNHIPLVAMTSDTLLSVPPRPYYYEVVPISSAWSLPLLAYLEAKKISRIAFVYDNTNPFATNAKTAAAAEAGKYGIRVVDYEPYTATTTDFSTIITHLESSNAQAVEVWDGGPTLVSFSEQAQAVGLQKKMKIVMQGAAAS